MQLRFIAKLKLHDKSEVEYRTVYARDIKSAKIIAEQLVGRTGKVLDLFASVYAPLLK